MEPGDRIGVYTVESKIGEGGMSAVYRAVDADGMQVVVKELKPQYLSSQQLVDRFLRGAKILTELRHPHLARVFEVFEHHGRHIVVEEYLGGGSLADMVDRGEPIAKRQALEWCGSALRALNYVHEFGIVHRDIKPSNLMLDANGRLCVIDFGIARVFGDIRLTRTGDSTIGTPWYMSPEQIITPDAVDHLTDVYSAGIVLYELLTGSVPYQGETQFSIFEKITREQPPPMSHFKPGIDPVLEKIVFKALAKAPGQRHGGCGEFAHAIEQYLSPGSERTPGDRTRHTLGSIASRARSLGTRPAAMGAIAVIVLLGVLLTTGAVSTVLNGRESTPLQPSETPQPQPLSPAEPTPVAIVERRPAIAIVTRVNGGESAEVRPPARVAYGYTVRNAGNVPLTNVRVTDRHGTAAVLRDGDSNGNGILDVDEVWEFGADVRVNAATAASGAFTSQAVATADQARADAAAVPVVVRRPAPTPIDTRTSVVAPPQKVRDVPPVYPAEAQAANVQGDVRLEITIGTDGGVQAVRVLTTPGSTELHRLLGRAAIVAARQWQYAPTMLNGVPVPVITSATVRFVLTPPPTPPAPPPATPRPDSSGRGAGAASPAAPVRVGGNLKQPRKLRDALPVYPAIAQSARVQGIVILEAIINADGRVRDARVLRSIPLLDAAALEAVRQWEYEPTMLNGTAVPVIITATVQFTLQ